VIVRLDKPAVLPELLTFLRLRVDCGVEQVGIDELDVTILGSYRDDAMRLELELRLRRWEAEHPGVQVEIVDQAEGRLLLFPIPDSIESPPLPQAQPVALPARPPARKRR
jgi:hypothetical protein